MRRPRLPRKPGPEPAPDPQGGRVYLVRYVDQNGQTHSEMFRKRQAADQFQGWVNRCGGHANVWSTDAVWTLLG